MLKKTRLFKRLAIACFLVLANLSCGSLAATDDFAQTSAAAKQRVSSFNFPTLYWAVPRPVAVTDWHAVFGGTVVKVKKEKQKFSEDLTRKFVGGEIEIERIFLNLPSGAAISVGDKFYGEDFENLKKGDKVIVFINGFYEKEFVRIKIDGTNSALGWKVKNWNEPIVAVLEKIAPCGKTEETRVEGHKRDFRTTLYDCREERDQMILENAEIWKRYDPKGFDELVERQKFLKEN